MKHNILLAGVGGMGILTSSRLITGAAIAEGKDALMSEIHGLAQRGGMVYTMVRIGDEISSPLIKRGSVDTILALEATESLRYLKQLSPEGIVIVNKNMVASPLATAGFTTSISLSKVLEKIRSFTKNFVFVPALEAARDLGNPIVQNTILVGSFFSSPTCPLNEESGREGIRKEFSGKGQQIIDLNLEAFDKGLDIGHDIF